jgi:translocation and assembly module TamB
LIALILVVLGLGAYLGRTDGGRDGLRRVLVSLGTDPAGLSLGLGALEGSLPGEVILRDLTLSDPDGVWLTLSEARLAWSPLALATGSLRVEALTARGLTVLRAPNLPPSDAPEAPSSPPDPRLLGLLTLDTLDLREITLGPALVGGEGARLSVTGALEPRGDTAARAVVSLVREDAPGRLDLSATVAGAPLALDLSLIAGEPQGGILARLLDLPGAPAARLSLTGAGPLEGWTGALDAGFDGVATLAGPLRLTADRDGNGTLGLDWTLTPGGAAPDLLAHLAGPETTLGLDAALADGSSLSLGRLDVAGPDWSLSARGDLSAEALDLTLRAGLASAAPLEPFVPELTAAPLTLDARVTGSAAQPAVDLRVVGGPLALAPVVRLEALALDGALRPRDGGFTLTLRGGPEGLDLPDGGPALVALLGGAPTLDLSATLLGDILTLEDLTATGATTTMTAKGRLDTARSLVEEATLDLAVPDLGPLGEALSRPLSGAAWAKATLSGFDLGAPSGAATLDAGLDDPVVDQTGPLDTILGPAPRLSARATLEEGGGLGDGHLALTAAGASVEGRGTLTPDGTLDATLRATLSDLGALAPGLSGAPVVDVVASGPATDPSLTGRVTLERLEGAGPLLTDARLNLTAGTLATGPAGVIDGTASLGGLPLALSVPFALDGAFATLDLWDGWLTLGRTRLDLTAQVDLASTLTAGQLTLTAPRLAELSALGAPDLSGSLTAEVALTPTEGRQDATLSVKAPGLSLAGMALGSPTITARARDLVGKPGLEAAVRSAGGDLGAVQWSSLALDARGGLADLGVSFDMNGAWEGGPLTASLGARVNAEAGPTVRLERLGLETGGKALSLVQPATLSLARGAVVDHLDLTLDGGRIGLSGGLEGGALKARGTVEALPLSLVTLVAPDSDLSGRLDATLTLSGPPTQPNGALTARITDLETARDIGDGRLSVALDAKLAPGRLTAEAALGGFGPRDARLSARLPLAPGPTLSTTGPLEARVDWAGEVADLWEFSPLVEHRLGGAATVDLRVSGSIDEPAVEGGLTLAKGRYENLVTGTVLRDLSVDLAGQPGHRVSLAVKATDGAAGRVSLDGVATLADLNRPEGTLTLSIADATLIRRDDALASLSADLAVALAGDHASLGGTVTTKTVDIRLAGGMGPSVADLEVIEVGGPGQPASVEEALLEREERLSKAAPPLPIALDLRVVMPNRVTVAGAGVDSEWKGALTVTGSANQPKVVGSVEAIRGTASFLGRDFSLREGVARFDGGQRIDPILSVTAENDTGDVTALVTVSGPASDPDIAFSSEPALPEDEIISRILFGKTSGELSAFEAVQLAQVAGQLAGFGGGRGITDALRDFTGLDVLRLGESGGGNTVVEAGTYVRENVYVGVEQGLGLEDSAVEVQVELTDQVTVETKAGANGTGEAGVFWKMDY